MSTISGNAQRLLFTEFGWKQIRKNGGFLKVGDDGKVSLVYLNCIQQLLRKILGFYSSTHLKTVVRYLSNDASGVDPVLKNVISASWNIRYPSEKMPELIIANEAAANQVPPAVADPAARPIAPQHAEEGRNAIPILPQPPQAPVADLPQPQPLTQILTPEQEAKKKQWNDLAEIVSLVKNQPVNFALEIDKIQHPFELNNPEPLLRFLIQVFPAIQFFTVSDIEREEHHWVQAAMDCPIHDHQGRLVLVEGICIKFNFQHEAYKVHLRANDEEPSGLWRRNKGGEWELIALNVEMPPEFAM